MTVPRTATNCSDDSFAVNGRRVWNSLPTELRSLVTLDMSRHKLKTFSFTQ